MEHLGLSLYWDLGQALHTDLFIFYMSQLINTDIHVQTLESLSILSYIFQRCSVD